MPYHDGACEATIAARGRKCNRRWEFAHIGGVVILSNIEVAGVTRPVACTIAPQKDGEVGRGPADRVLRLAKGEEGSLCHVADRGERSEINGFRDVDDDLASL